MSANGAKQPLQHESPEVIVLGDDILDLFVYDKRAEDADKSLAWTAPLSRDDWHYAFGFATRRCVAGAAAIHAMLWANGIPVAGNSFRDGKERRPIEESGSIFVLRERANPGKDKKSRTRSYLVTRPEARDGKNEGTTAKFRDDYTTRSFIEDLKYRNVSEDRSGTWQADVSLLNQIKEKYVKTPLETKVYEELSKAANGSLKAVCLWDVDRGFFRQDKDEEWQREQQQLFTWYKSLWSGGNKPAVVIRTSDPRHFEEFLKNLGQENDSPTVVLICALAQLKDGDLRVAGTWSAVWEQLYEYLKSKSYLFGPNPSGEGKPNWKFHIVVPVYQDGVIWIGPGRWPIERPERRKHPKKDDLPLGSLFMVPGAQPGLSEFEEHGRLIGVHTLLAQAIVEHVAKDGTDPNHLALPIRQGLMRIRRVRNSGYAAPDEMMRFRLDKPDAPDFYIGYPCEVWRSPEREVTDILLNLGGFAGDRDLTEDLRQRAGPYEVKCDLETKPAGRLFHAIDKIVGDGFVASLKNCIRVASDVNCDRHRDLIDGDWLKIEGNTYPVDSFSKLVIESSWLRQRIAMQFGEFGMADPREARAILDLAQRAKQHVLHHRFNSPDKGRVFNFALFGSPGSGKSFLAREIAASIDPAGQIFTHQEYNISQFSDPAQLTDAFKTIASEGVGGKVPMVLWDEFDTVLEKERGGWLARFLMPMQDAHFFDGGEKRPFGTAVFVFIGGTFATAEDFRKWACDTKEKKGKPPESVLLKARDFHSRLYTALNMPRIIEESPPEAPGQRCQIFMTNWEYSYAMLARAVLLRHYFRKGSEIRDKHFLKEIEDDLCRFLLAIPLRHGARSLERIVEACLVSKPGKLGMMHLPPNSFLEEHIETVNVRQDGAEKLGLTIDEMKGLIVGGG